MNNTTRMPTVFTEFEGEGLMSNFDREINQKTKKAIKGKNIYSRYAGWNFNGLVWWQNNNWNCEVWQYKTWMETITCKSLEAIMKEVSNEYGWD